MSPSAIGHILSSVAEHDALEQAAVGGHVVDEPSPPLRVGERGHPLGQRQVGDLARTPGGTAAD